MTFLITNSTIYRLFFCILYFAVCILTSTAQQASAARYEIDAKRVGVNPGDKDALPRSREFIRLDSTYYVGHMYEGLYKYEKSSDFIGFRNTIPSLRKAIVLFEKDYAKNLRTLFTSPQAYMQSMNRYIDYLQIANSLKECYDNLEMPDSVMWVLNRVSAYNFPKEHLPVETTKAWTYHRNRFFTSEKFSFLRNSVEENEQMAFGHCYYALAKIDYNEPRNNMWYGPGQAEVDRMSVYHYLALLHAYNKHYDSSEYYYQIMANRGTVSWNNYGNMKHEVGELAVAIDFLNKDKYKYFQKVLREPYYYLPMLHVYAGRTKEAMAMCKEAIEMSGSTPGFGWYNLALGRSYLYDGQLDSAEYVIRKAADFREIHIGTTLTQSQYEFTINMLKLQLSERKIALVKFNNRGWWYSPTSLYKIASLKIQKILLQYVLINQMTSNPERDRTVYDLFCGEATTTFDEAYYLIKDFSPGYFVKKYQQYQVADPRTNLQKYFRLVTRQMQWERGKEKEAFKGYQELAREVTLDTANEKLFLARLFEGLAKGNDEDGTQREYDFYSNSLYENYPQLLPFTGLRLKMKINSGGIDDDATQQVLKEIKQCNIEWVNEADANTPIANIVFNKRGDKYEATVNVKGGSDKTMVTDEKMIFKKPEGAGKELALRLFGKSGAKVFEKIDAGN